VEDIQFDFRSGVTVSENGDPDSCFLQLISDQKTDSQEIPIFIDGSRMLADDGDFDVGCAVMVPCQGKSHQFKLNRFSNSYTAELIAMIKAIDIELFEC